MRADYLLRGKSAYKWAIAFQTHVIQGSTVVPMSSFGGGETEALRKIILEVTKISQSTDLNLGLLLPHSKLG